MITKRLRAKRELHHQGLAWAHGTESFPKSHVLPDSFKWLVLIPKFQLGPEPVLMRDHSSRAELDPLAEESEHPRLYIKCQPAVEERKFSHLLTVPKLSSVSFPFFQGWHNRAPEMMWAHRKGSGDSQTILKSIATHMFLLIIDIMCQQISKTQNTEKISYFAHE